MGCGYGADVVALRRATEAGRTRYRVDLSEAKIREARRRTAGIAPHVGFLVADALALPFADNTFDICP